MLFNSYLFVLVFLPACLAAWWSLPLRTEQRLALLAAASYVFYGLWDWRFTGLLAASTVLDYAIGHRLAAVSSDAARKRWMLASVTVNLSVLAVFKYAGFAASNFNAIAAWLHSGGQLPVWDIVLPYTRTAVIGGVFLGLGRALGETMAVTFVIGNAYMITSSLFMPGSTIASSIANEFNEAVGLHRSALIALGFLLFVVTFIVLLIARLMLRQLAKREGGE